VKPANVITLFQPTSGDLEVVIPFQFVLKKDTIKSLPPTFEAPALIKLGSAKVRYTLNATATYKSKLGSSRNTMDTETSLVFMGPSIRRARQLALQYSLVSGSTGDMVLSGREPVHETATKNTDANGSGKNEYGTAEKEEKDEEVTTKDIKVERLADTKDFWYQMTIKRR
jgi:hypothetical protein